MIFVLIGALLFCNYQPNISPTEKMKPMTRSSSSRTKIRLAVVLLLGVCLTSCATSSSQSKAATKSPPPAAPAAIQTVGPNWVKVCSNPPTWYPRGTPADTPTDFRSGEWVYTDDEQATRFFIPLHVTGTIPRQALVNEALTARSTRKKVKTATENCVDCFNAIGNLVVGTPLTFMAMYGAAAGTSNGVSGDDVPIIVPFGR